MHPPSPKKSLTCPTKTYTIKAPAISHMNQENSIFNCFLLRLDQEIKQISKLSTVIILITLFFFPSHYKNNQHTSGKHEVVHVPVCSVRISDHSSSKKQHVLVPPISDSCARTYTLTQYSFCSSFVQAGQC